VTLSVVVATRDRPDFLDECLASLRMALTPDDELIVVDSASKTMSTSAVAKAHGARVIRCSTPGTSVARNAGWRAARGNWVAFVDDDVRVDPGWSNALHAAVSTSPDLSFLTGRLRLPYQAERPVAVFDDANPIRIDRDTVEDVGHGANFAARRDALDAVGGYDESLGPGARWQAGEDLELIDRLIATGLNGRYEPGVSGYHVQWRTSRDLFSLEWRYGLGQGARLALLWQLDRKRCRAIAKRTTWDSGVIELYRSAVRGWERIAVRALIRLAGTSVGFVGMAAGQLRRAGSSEGQIRADPGQ